MIVPPHFTMRLKTKQGEPLQLALPCFSMSAGLSRHLAQSAALACFFPATMDSMFKPSPFATPIP